MSKKKESGKGKKPTPATPDVVASNSGDDDTQVNVEENTLASMEKVSVATPTATNEEISSEDVDLDKELEQKGTIKEEEIANNDTTEAETAGEEEAAKLAAEAEVAAKKSEEEAAAAAAKIMAEEGRRTVRGDASFFFVVSSHTSRLVICLYRGRCSPENGS